MPALPLRTTLLTTIYDRIGRTPPDELTAQERQKARSFSWPLRPPVTWVTGSVPAGVRIEPARAEARDAYQLPLRVYHPAGPRRPRPVVVYFHGGGWVLGSTRGYDPLCGYLAASVDAVVVSVDYRLAPEHPAPAAALDCVDAVRLVGSFAAEVGGDPDRIAVAGDSAGGNLAAVVSQVLRDDGGPRLAGQALLYPGVDATMSFPSVSQLADAPILTRRDIVGFLHCYLGESDLDPRDPLVSPLWSADLSGLPPTLVQTADQDPLRDEGQAYASALAAAGVPVRATNYLGVPHGFMSFPGATTCGRQARLELTTELRRYLT